MSILEEIVENNEEVDFLKADGFDQAVIGYDHISNRLIYSYKKCIQILIKDMELIDAIEYLDFNVINSYVGDSTPIWCMDKTF